MTETETREFKALIDRLWEEIPSQYARTVEHSLRHLMRERDEALGMREWQPIETAKRDGSRFLAFELGRTPDRYECFWETGFSDWDGTALEGWKDDWGCDVEPTHWQPFTSPGEES